LNKWELLQYRLEVLVMYLGLIFRIITGGCRNKEHSGFPIYGVAPHDCFYKIGKNIGESEVHPVETWPENFVVDKEDNNCGIYYCPTCMEGK